MAFRAPCRCLPSQHWQHLHPMCWRHRPIYWGESDHRILVFWSVKGAHRLQDKLLSVCACAVCLLVWAGFGVPGIVPSAPFFFSQLWQLRHWPWTWTIRFWLSLTLCRFFALNSFDFQSSIGLRAKDFTRIVRCLWPWRGFLGTPKCASYSGWHLA